MTDKDNHPIKANTHEKVLNKFLSVNSVENMRKWIQLLNRILTPVR